MDHLAGLDVSVKETSVCIVDDTGKIIREVKVASEPEASLAVLKNPGLHSRLDRAIPQTCSTSIPRMAETIRQAAGTAAAVITCRVKRSVGRSVVPGANASVPSCTPADGPAGMADGGSGHADTCNSCPAQAAAVGYLCDHALRLMNWRGCHCFRRCCEG